MENNKKRRMVLLFSILAFIIFAGSLFALFSDVVTGNAKIKAGTLDIKGTYTYKYNGSSTPFENFEITNFNPGDTVVITATISNLGTKSAWVRDSIQFSGDLLNVLVDGSNESVISVYEGDVDVNNTTNTPLTMGQNGFLVLGKGVIDGSMEKETYPGSNQDHTVSFTIYFNKLAKNDAQGKSIEATIKTEALQYRNNTSEPIDNDWNMVESLTIQTP